MTTPEPVPGSATATPTGEPRQGRPPWALVGALIFLVIGLTMLVPAVHIATVPILLPTAAGPAFNCGSALYPPTKPFPVRVCGAQPKRYQEQAAAWGVAAVILGVGGVLAFLVPTRPKVARHSRRRGEEPDLDVAAG